MEKQQEQNLKSEKKSTAGVIGFILALASFITCGLTAIPGIIYSVIGIHRKGHRILASIGLLISLIVICLLSLHILRSTKPGSVSYPINLIKYRLACKSHFWIEYDKLHIVKAQSRHYLIFGSFGSIHFRANETGNYKFDDIIKFAEKSGWIYRGKMQLKKEEFVAYFEDWEVLQDENFELWNALYLLTSYNRSPLWIQNDCTVLGFDTGNHHGIPSYVMILNDGSEMVVRASHMNPPDPGEYPFRLPELFEEND